MGSDPTPKSVNNNEDSEDGDSQSVSGRPRRSRGRSLLERNPDFLVDVSSRRSSVDSSKESTPMAEDSMKISDTLTIKWSAKSEKLSGSIVVPKTDAKVPSSSTKPTKTDKNPKRGRPLASKSPDKRPHTSKSPEKRPQSTPSKRSRSMSEEVEASLRPKRSLGRTLMDRNPDFQMDSMAFLTSKRTEREVLDLSLPLPQKEMVPVSSNSKSPARGKGTNSRQLPIPDIKKNAKNSKILALNIEMSSTAVTPLSKAPEIKESPEISSRGRSGKKKVEQIKEKEIVESPSRPRRSVGRNLSDRHPDFQVEGSRSPSTRPSTESRLSIQDGERSSSEDASAKWKTSTFRATHLNLLDKALSSVGWGQKHRNAKNMEQEVFQNATSEEAYVSKISRLVVYFSNGYQPNHSPSVQSPG